MKLRDRRGLRDLTIDELRNRIYKSKEILFRQRFKHAATPLKNPLEIRWVRRDIARYETLIREKLLVAK